MIFYLKKLAVANFFVTLSVNDKKVTSVTKKVKMFSSVIGVVGCEMRDTVGLGHVII
jgi:hypothetical protein